MMRDVRLQAWLVAAMAIACTPPPEQGRHPRPASPSSGFEQEQQAAAGSSSLKDANPAQLRLARRLRIEVEALLLTPHSGIHPPMGNETLAQLEKDVSLEIPAQLRVLYSEIGVPEYWPRAGTRIAVFFHDDLVRDVFKSSGLPERLPSYFPFADDSGPSWYFIDTKGRDGRSPGSVVRCDRGALAEDDLELLAPDLVSFLRWLRGEA
jgi:hypothetical protein